MSAPYLIEELSVQGSRIVVAPGPEFRKTYAEKPFYAEYGGDVDLASLPRDTLLLPFLFNVLPVIWRSGDRYRVRSLDSQAASSLSKVRESFRRLHPGLAWDGEVIPDRLNDSESASAMQPEEVALLFSGGADSVYTSLTHRRIPQVMITILSALGVYDWENPLDLRAAQDHFVRLAEASGHRSAFVSSNFARFIPYPKLAGLWPRPRRWLVEVQHGLGFVGLAAPILACFRIPRLLMAGCELDHYGFPSGSHPAIVGSIRWSGTEVLPDGIEVKRQEKIRAIHAMAAESEGPVPTLKPCLRPTKGFGNCGICSKCMQTILGLWAAGGDLAAYGFDTPLEWSFAALREQLRTFRLPLPDLGELRQWQDIQSALRDRVQASGSPDGISPQGEVDLHWFLAFDLGRHYARMYRPLRRTIRRIKGRLGVWLKIHPRWNRPVRAAQRTIRRVLGS